LRRARSARFGSRCSSARPDGGEGDQGVRTYERPSPALIHCFFRGDHPSDPRSRLASSCREWNRTSTCRPRAAAPLGVAPNQAAVVPRASAAVTVPASRCAGVPFLPLPNLRIPRGRSSSQLRAPYSFSPCYVFIELTLQRDGRPDRS
jgi:hypothetical protein